ncbi:MAG TPA: hypothetical protein VLA37_13160 [Sphingomonadaceae bacterium]|nr:hypothetical protein [Sphingomonadaceae bacterium]
MRKFIGLAAIAAVAMAGPALAQQDDGREILNRVLQSILGPEPTPTPAPGTPEYQQGTRIEQVLAHPRRDADRARDRYRHPEETLRFFQVEPGMTVVDYMPADGWYSRILIPYLGEQGTYIGLNPELVGDFGPYWDMYRNAPTRIPADARQWVGNEGANVFGANTDEIPSWMNGRADRFLIFREIHNMRRFGWLHDSLLAARTMLKADGLLGVVQHRARANAPASYTLGDNGYQREEDVVALFHAYGFELVSRSEINANPNDPANWEGGVWALPPSLRGADTQAERDRRTAIGESDRMTLLFRKRP